METSRSLNQHNQRSSDQVFHCILDHYYLAIYDDPKFESLQFRISVGFVVFATTSDNNEAKFLLRKNISKIVEDFEQQLMSRLYK